MKTRILISLLTVLITSTIAHAQESRKTSCPIEELAIEAALGETTAQYNLAVEFFRGERVPRDYAKAAKLWRSASDAGLDVERGICRDGTAARGGHVE